MAKSARSSERDRGMTALIEGFFAFVWFGWGQADASSGLRVALAAGMALAIAVAILGAIRAFRNPAASSALHGRQRWRRYGIIVGVEFLLAGAGAGLLEALGLGTFVPVWVCAVVGVHFFVLAPVLQDRLLVPLGALISAVAVVALMVGRWTGLAPSTVTGVGAGSLLLCFAAFALANRPPLRPGPAAEQDGASDSSPSDNRTAPHVLGRMASRSLPASRSPWSGCPDDQAGSPVPLRLPPPRGSGGRGRGRGRLLRLHCLQPKPNDAGRRRDLDFVAG